ncbi:hypothetical protein K458DRAFT_371306 [Lentithecium fluviatile CBS 122367]|uniref:Rhodopsin domain-containing protein n=1 Tax=Lentithecium fluviatile CBS 122367 TaxID=1168545 RepID=A0A6G1IUR8_9PLEO|nr:hypothetical protein K458DRAFT_371306 [Lentithecium fluviatile CBS 122367]
MAPYKTSMIFPTTILVVNSTGLLLSFVAVVLRFWARKIRRTKLRLSDHTIIASWIFTLGLVISENYCVTRGGVGQATQEVTLDQLLFSTKQFLVIGVTGTLAVTLVKISFLDLFISIFASADRFRVVANALMGITASYGVSFTIVTLAGCQPFDANWDKLSHPDYKCINTSKFYVVQGAIGAVLDILILLLPLPIIWKLQLKTSKKVGLTIVFTVGILICAISMTRLVYNTRQGWMLTHFTEYAGTATLLGALEANLSIVCACLPLLQPLFVNFSERMKSKFSSDHSTFRLLNPFSSSHRRPTHDSVKLTSSTDKPGVAVIEDDLEVARSQRQYDNLYPISVPSASQPSFEEQISPGERFYSGQTGHGRSAFTGSGGVFEMERMDGGSVHQKKINVTKTWEVKNV